MNKSPPALFFQTKALRSLGEIVRRSFFDGVGGMKCAVPGLQIALLFNDNQAVPPSSLQCPFCWPWRCKGKPERRKWRWKWEIPLDRMLKYHFTPRVEHEDRKCSNVWVQGLSCIHYWCSFFCFIKFWGGLGERESLKREGWEGQKIIVLVTCSVVHFVQLLKVARILVR